MDKKTIKGIDYYIYSDEIEFRKFHLGSDVKDWRDESVVEGDWIKTDKGGITKCLKISKFGKDDSRIIMTICGRFKVGSHTMDNTIRKYHNRFVSAKGTQKKQTEIPLRKKDKAFARLTMLGMDGIEAFKKINPDAKSVVYIKQRISTITNKKGYDEYMSEEYTKLLIDQDMTKKWSLKILKEIAEDAKAPAGVRKEIADDIIEDLGEQRKGFKQIETTQWYAKHQVSDGELTQVKEIGEKKKEEKEIKGEDYQENAEDNAKVMKDFKHVDKELW